MMRRLLIASRLAVRARICPLQEIGRGLLENEAACSWKRLESSKK